MMTSRSDRLWAVVLAAGEGTRLAPLTSRLYGKALPKQFATLVGESSLLQETVLRLLPLIPSSRIVVVVPAAYLLLARRQLSRWPEIQIVAQPENRGTGPGILLPIAHVLARDPDARILIVPSDHHVANPMPLLEAAQRAAASVDEVPIALLGVEADGPETEYGWIRTGKARSGGLQAVDGFVEKPPQRVAESLFRERALWNTFILAARARTLWDITATRLPAQAAAIDGCVRDRGPRALRLARSYASMASANFSREVLETTPDLAVATVKGSGWCDWGSPERVFACLEDSRSLDPLLRRLDRSDAATERPDWCPPSAPAARGRTAGARLPPWPDVCPIGSA
jgi:mannose-1-phosphate guanylyltransferase